MNKKVSFFILLLVLPLLLGLFTASTVQAIEDTFTGETIDGFIQYGKSTYPPEPDGLDAVGTAGTAFQVGQYYSVGSDYYWVYRTYVSFDTSALPDEALVSSAVLQLKTESDHSTTDFNVRIYGDSQPIWGDSLTVSDWGCGDVLLDSWNTVNYVDETYFDFVIPIEQINKQGRTQFEVLSDRELGDITPVGEEYVYFHTGDSGGNQPKLVITYTDPTSPTGGMKQTIGDNWLYAGEWHTFESTYTYGGTFDTVKLAFSDLYDSYALDFEKDDTDYIQVSDDDSLEPTSITVMAWVTAESLQDWGKIVCKPYLGDGTWAEPFVSYSLELYSNTGKPSMVVSVAGTRHLTYALTPLELDTWYHLAGVYDGEIVKLYVDGELTQINNDPSGVIDYPAEVQDLMIGDRNALNHEEYWDGKIEDVKIFGVALSETEIQYNMNHMKPYDLTDLTASFHMDEGTGTTVWDASIEQNTGTNNGASYVDGVILIDDHWIIAVYDVTDDEWILESGDAIATIQAGTTEQIGNDFIVSYEIFFKNSILDRLDGDIYIYTIDTNDDVDPWDEIATDYFNIYNLGGFTTFEKLNVAGRIEGGDVFDLYADGSNAWVRVEQIYRKIQHVKVQCGFVIKNVNDVGDVYARYGIDFVDPTTGLFIKGWNVLINITAINVTQAAHCTLEVRWYYNDEQIGTTDTMYSMWEDQAFMTPDGEYSGTRFHLDLWFNKVNGSSVIGGRVAPFMYGLTQNNPPWWLWWNWWGAGEWKPMRVNTTDSFLFTNLQDYTGETITSKALDLTRFWCNLTNVGANDDIYVMNYRVLDYTFASGDMEGINTPPFPETLDPELPAGGGILSGLFNALKGLAQTIGNVLTSGILALWSTFVSSLDMIFTFAGWSNGFSVLLSWISSFLTWMVDGIGYAISLLLSTFEVMASWLSFAIGRFTVIATGFVNIYNVLVDIWTQANTGWLSITSWLTPLLPLLPLCIFIWIFSARNTEGMIGRITMLWNLVRTTIGFLIQIGQFVISTIYGLIELVPVAE